MFHVTRRCFNTFRCVPCKVKRLTKHVIMLKKIFDKLGSIIWKHTSMLFFVVINKTNHEFPDKIMLKSCGTIKGLNVIKGTLSRWQNLKKSSCFFQVRILSSWWYHNDETFFQLHYTGIVIFIKSGPVSVGFRCCKMCLCTLEFCACQPVTVPLYGDNTWVICRRIHTDQTYPYRTD